MDVDQAQDKATRDNRLQALEARLAAHEKEDKDSDTSLKWLRAFKVSGYLQPQLLWTSWNTAASSNLTAAGTLPPGVTANSTTAKADGTTTNPDYFRLRRARLKIEYMPTDYARFVMEIDPVLSGGPTNGTGTIARNVEADGIAHWDADVTTTFGVGIFKIPLGWEVLQSDADRPFIERSWGEQNLVPGEFDTGAKAYTSVRTRHGGVAGNDGKLDVQLAVVNGITLVEKTFAVLPDLNKGKDLVGRINYDLGDWLDFGVSGYYGQGQAVDAPALRFKQFPRWAFNGEIGVHHEWKPGWRTKILSELTLAQNLDRGTKYTFAVPSIPTPISNDVTNFNERAVWVRLEQDFTEWFTLGLRYDMYTPDTSIKNDARDTYGAVAVLHFTKGLQWMNEFDHAIDNVRKSGPAPSKQIETFSSVLQVRF
jgi:hypothetical protein